MQILANNKKKIHWDQDENKILLKYITGYLFPDF